jgi:hypothetical protein
MVSIGCKGSVMSAKSPSMHQEKATQEANETVAVRKRDDNNMNDTDITRYIRNISTEDRDHIEIQKHA